MGEGPPRVHAPCALLRPSGASGRWSQMGGHTGMNIRITIVVPCPDLYTVITVLFQLWLQFIQNYSEFKDKAFWSGAILVTRLCWPTLVFDLEEAVFTAWSICLNRWFWPCPMTLQSLDTETTWLTPWDCGQPKPPANSTSRTVSPSS